MSYSRIFGILDQELGRHVAFAFSITENLTRRGVSSIRPGDRFLMTVWATNNSAIPLKFLEGLVSPTPLTQFQPTRFRLARLGPGKRRQLATIEAEVTRRPGIAHLRFDQIGRIAVSISADLSRYRVQQSAQLTYERSA